MAYTANSPRYINGVYSRELAINKVYYNSFATNDFDCKSPNGQGYLDRTFTHEMTHAIMMSKINYFNDLPSFIVEGTAELTHGIDDFRTYSINTLADNPNLLESCLNIDNPCLDYDYEYASGYMLLRYLGKQGEKYLSSATSSNIAASSISKSIATDSQVTLKGALLTVSKDFSGESLDLKDYSSKIKNINASKVSKGIMIIGNKNNNSIVSGAGADTISGNVGKDTISGGAGHDILKGDAGNDSINGGTGNDTINGGSGSNTLTGGMGKDIFVHNADKDFITDYKVGEDKIKITEGEITSSSLSGFNVILNVEDKGSVTIKNGKGKKITVIDSNGNETSKVYKTSSVVSDNTLLVTNKTKSPVTVGSSIEVIDASGRTKAIKITGNAKDNTIGGSSAKDTIDGGKGNDYILGNAGNDSIVGKNGNDILFGNAGNDTLWGGADNDSLYGGEGNDAFIYKSGDGKDVIYGFENDDMLKITGAFSTSRNKSKNEVYFKVGSTSNAITLKNFTATTFNINGTAYKLGSSQLVRK